MKILSSRLLYIAVTASLLTGSGCHRKRSASQMDSHLNGNTYTNSFYGFTIIVPTNWVVLNKAAIENPASQPPPPPKRVRNPATGQMFEMSDVELYNLITIVENTNLFPDTTRTALGATNLSFSIVSQYVQPVEAYSGKDYLEMVFSICEILEAPNSKIQNAGPSEVLVGGRKFWRDTFRRNYKGTSFSERIYARVEGGYALAFVLTAPKDGDLDKLEQIMATAQFH